MTPDELTAVARELEPLQGARIQRVDVIDDGELSIELRVPGRTLRLLLVTRPGFSRAHLIAERPTKRKTPGGLQGLLRKHLEGRPLTWIEADAEARTLTIDAPGARLVARMGAGNRGIDVREVTEHVTKPRVMTAVPDRFPINEALAERYGARAETDAIDRLRRALLARVDGELKRTRRLLGRLDGDAKGLERHAASARHGELLKSALHGIQRGQTSVTAIDWSTGEAVEVEVPLDPTLDARGNLQRLFAKAKRAERGLPQIARRREEAEARVKALAEERAAIVAADEEALRAMASAREPDEGALPVARASQADAAPQTELDRWARRFVVLGGLEARVGRGARENDRLTLSAARGHDLWLHARGVPGAHVLLRLTKGQAAPEDALVDAAHLAAHFSSAKGEPKVEVVYTEARNVRKMKGATPGQVAVSKERTMLLRVEPSRLERLLGQ